jgi:NADPH-dependent 2,4-dienoyl-CoA reductase/sulfur reductase-like enzyme/rhodanese-related sulfurtransferase
MKKILIIGGVAGGATAAARARRVDETAEITMIEMGKYVSFANCGLPYYIAGDIKSRNKLLLQTPGGFHDRYRIQVLVETEATFIDRQNKKVKINTKGVEQELSYDSLILSQGGRPIVPDIPGVKNKHVFILRDIDDMDGIHHFIQAEKPKSAIIVGGGFIGLEMAEALHKREIHVRIVEKADQVMINHDKEFSEMILGHLKENKIDVSLKTSLISIDSSSKTAKLEDGSEVSADMILFSIGVRPELSLARQAGLEIGETGGVLVNSNLQSSDPNIYVVGDMAEITHRVSGKKVRVPLAGPANRQGRIAGSNAAGEKRNYRGALGSSIAKVCDRTVATTGLSEKTLKANGIEYGSVTVHPNHHAGYYPGAKQLTLKLLYAKKDGKVLGAQAFGEEGVDKRIDVVATAILGGLTVYDLEEIDLTYAPPYSSANDPVNMASFVAENDLIGFSPVVTAEQFFENLKGNPNAYVLDVRNIDEYESGHIEGSVNIPLPILRDKLQEIPKDKDIYVHCRVGYRGHLGARILLQNGFNRVWNITGGYLSMEVLMNK